MIRLRPIPRVACVLACATLFTCPAIAQQYKCVDASGRVTYSDKGGPGCTGGRAPAAKAAEGKAPPVPATKLSPGPSTPPRALLDAAKASSAPGKAPPPAAAQPAETKAQIASRCTATRQEYDWLRSKRGEGVAGRDARLAQMERALAACP